LKALKAQGVKIVALRCSGTNNVDIKTAKEIGHVSYAMPPSD
jgi:lactate dehydrogenase-like 2-hydroxyacid dehydrogenase